MYINHQNVYCLIDKASKVTAIMQISRIHHRYCLMSPARQQSPFLLCQQPSYQNLSTLLSIPNLSREKSNKRKMTLPELLRGQVTYWSKWQNLILQIDQVYARLFWGIKLKRRQQNFPNSRILSCIEVTFMPFISLGKLQFKNMIFYHRNS